MSAQSLGTYLKQIAIEKEYSNIFIAQSTHIHKTNISKHFNNNLKISDSDLRQYCKLFQLAYPLIKASYSQVEHYVCDKETTKKIFAGLAAASVGIGASTLVYHIVKNKLDENCSNRFLTT